LIFVLQNKIILSSAPRSALKRNTLYTHQGHWTFPPLTECWVTNASTWRIDVSAFIVKRLSSHARNWCWNQTLTSTSHFTRLNMGQRAIRCFLLQHMIPMKRRACLRSNLGKARLQLAHDACTSIIRRRIAIWSLISWAKECQWKVLYVFLKVSIELHTIACEEYRTLLWKKTQFLPIKTIRGSAKTSEEDSFERYQTLADLPFIAGLNIFRCKNLVNNDTLLAHRKFLLSYSQIPPQQPKSYMGSRKKMQYGGKIWIKIKQRTKNMR